MGAFLDKPKTEKFKDSGQGNGLRFAVSAMQGWRVDMEDAHCAQLGLGGQLQNWAFFSIFDGHAGGKVARHCSQHLLEFILSAKETKEALVVLSSGQSGQETEKSIELIRRGIRSGFLALDEHMKKLPELHGDNERSGTTVVAALISPSHIYFANLGDSRGLLSRNRSVHFATEDHKPFHQKERERIVNAGGSVMIQRVNGSLAVSRALGDYEYKGANGVGACEQLVSPEPDVHVVPRQAQDEYLLLACDGVFDVMSNQELADFVRSRMLVTDQLTLICDSVLDSCLSKGSRDNMSLALVAFAGCPSIQQAALQEEKQLKVELEKRIKGIIALCDSTDDVDGEYVLRILMNQDIPGVPPGAGLHAMRDSIEEIVEQVKTSGACDGNSSENAKRSTTPSTTSNAPLSSSKARS